ncbi:PKD domain-containing protein [Candidatus Micrarchaeota archaeon]|nr:PKD domain-containing protein [Candidatus Micrarchaeota archaeon]
MKEKGQTGLEYLLMIGGVVLLVAVAVMVLTATGEMGTNTVHNAQHKAEEEIEEFEGPRAGFDVNTNSIEIPEGDPVELHVGFTDTSTPAANIVEWEWDFGDGETEIINAAPGDTTYQYTEYGRFLAILKVTDNDGRKSYADELISIIPPDTPPDANFSYRHELSAIKTINFFDDSNSGSPDKKDLDDAIIEWNWDFGDDVNSTEQNPVHQYDDYYEGGIEVILTVNDKRGGESTTTGNVRVLGVCGNGIAEPTDACGLEYDFSDPDAPVEAIGCLCFLAERTECENCSRFGAGSICCALDTETPGECIPAGMVTDQSCTIISD